MPDSIFIKTNLTKKTLLECRGVVQLFNSVKIQQKTIQDKLREAGPLERKREKALKSIDKSDFLELLKGGKKGKTNVTF